MVGVMKRKRWYEINLEEKSKVGKENIGSLDMEEQGDLCLGILRVCQILKNCENGFLYKEYLFFV